MKQHLAGLLNNWLLVRSCHGILLVFDVQKVDGAMHNYHVLLASETGLLVWTGDDHSNVNFVYLVKFGSSTAGSCSPGLAK